MEVAPQAAPPVCRIMDYGRYKFDATKRAKDQRRRQATTQLKEMQLKPKIADHDFLTKFRGVRRFLEQGEKVKVTIRFRGRELAHQEIGRKLLDRVAEEAQELAVVERAPAMEGRSMFMILAPSHKVKEKEAAPANAEA